MLDALTLPNILDTLMAWNIKAMLKMLARYFR